MSHLIAYNDTYPSSHVTKGAFFLNKFKEQDLNWALKVEKWYKRDGIIRIECNGESIITFRAGRRLLKALEEVVPPPKIKNKPPQTNI